MLNSKRHSRQRFNTKIEMPAHSKIALIRGDGIGDVINAALAVMEKALSRWGSLRPLWMKSTLARVLRRWRN